LENPNKRETKAKRKKKHVGEEKGKRRSNSKEELVVVVVVEEETTLRVPVSFARVVNVESVEHGLVQTGEVAAAWLSVEVQNVPSPEETRVPTKAFGEGVVVLGGLAVTALLVGVVWV